MNQRQNITPQLLRELLDYDPETGSLTWKRRNPKWFADGKRGACAAANVWNARYAGKYAFTALDTNGYRRGAIFRQSLYGHRVAWAVYYGEWPDDEIDHIDGSRANNKIENLRAASRSENCLNIAMKSSNTSGVTGVSWDKINELWESRIHNNGKCKRLGRFACLSAAAIVRKAAESRYGYTERHGT